MTTIELLNKRNELKSAIRKALGIDPMNTTEEIEKKISELVDLVIS